MTETKIKVYEDDGDKKKSPFNPLTFLGENSKERQGFLNELKQQNLDDFPELKEALKNPRTWEGQFIPDDWAILYGPNGKSTNQYFVLAPRGTTHKTLHYKANEGSYSARRGISEVYVDIFPDDGEFAHNFFTNAPPRQYNKLETIIVPYVDEKGIEQKAMIKEIF